MHIRSAARYHVHTRPRYRNLKVNGGTRGARHPRTIAARDEFEVTSFVFKPERRRMLVIVFNITDIL